MNAVKRREEEYETAENMEGLEQWRVINQTEIGDILSYFSFPVRLARDWMTATLDLSQAATSPLS